jgi:Glycosyltransferase family 87
MTLVWFLPLTTLSYLRALVVWDVFSLACLLAGIAILLRSHPMPSTSEASFLALACLAFPPVFVTLLQGQVSLLLFFFATLVYHSLKRKKEVQAGLWLSLLLTKFQLLLPFVAVFLWKRQWKALGGFLMGSLLALLISLSLVGVAGVKGYVQLAIEVAGWVNTKGMTPASMHCLRGQFNAWWYDSHPLLAMIVTIGCSFVLLALLIRTWQINWHEGFDLRFSLLVIVSVLVSPHLYFHDLSLLLVPGLLVYRFAIRNQEAEMKIRSLPVFLFITGYLLLWLSLIVSNLIPLQPSVWALIAWSVLLAGIAHRSRGSLAEVNALTATPRSRATGDTAFDR